MCILHTRLNELENSIGKKIFSLRLCINYLSFSTKKKSVISYVISLHAFLRSMVESNSYKVFKKI